MQSSRQVHDKGKLLMTERLTVMEFDKPYNVQTFFSTWALFAEPIS